MTSLLNRRCAAGAQSTRALHVEEDKRRWATPPRSSPLNAFNSILPPVGEAPELRDDYFQNHYTFYVALDSPSFLPTSASVGALSAPAYLPTRMLETVAGSLAEVSTKI